MLSFPALMREVGIGYVEVFRCPIAFCVRHEISLGALFSIFSQSVNTLYLLGFASRARQVVIAVGGCCWSFMSLSPLIKHAALSTDLTA